MDRVVLDTDVVLAGVLSGDRASRELLVGALDHRFSLLLSTPLLLEYEDILLKPDRVVGNQITGAEIIEILDALAGVCCPIAFDHCWHRAGSHPGSDIVVETAINGQADFVATLDLDQLGDAGTRYGFSVQDPNHLAMRLLP